MPVGYFLNDCQPALFVHAPGRARGCGGGSVALGTELRRRLWARALALETDAAIATRCDDLAAILLLLETAGIKGER